MFPFYRYCYDINHCFLFKQCRKRKLKVSIIGVPKTIDNDILLMDRTFGFDTAVEEALRAINSAYIEVSFFTLPFLFYYEMANRWLCTFIVLAVGC